MIRFIPFSLAGICSIVINAARRFLLTWTRCPHSGFTRAAYCSLLVFCGIVPRGSFTVAWRLHFYILTASCLFSFLLKCLISLRQLNLFLPLEVMTRTNICRHPDGSAAPSASLRSGGVFPPLPAAGGGGRGWECLCLPLSLQQPVGMCSCQDVIATSKGHLESWPDPPLGGAGSVAKGRLQVG